MQRTHLISALAILALAPVAWAVPDGGGAMGPRNAPNTAQDPQTTARNEYNLGYEGVQSVAKLELEAALMPAFASQYRDTVRAGFVRARENFRKAVAADPDMKEAWNMLGFTSRKLGEYEESLKAYDKALALAPSYPEAIEYRGELFLLTGRLAQTKEAYATLLTLDPSYAGVLKTSMQDFLKKGQTFPASVTPQESEDFAKWVNSL
ncbi:MAG TPA: tetratricopeptide repeat protein [Steroidobacteraceae bacterium]|nr:tetratricopeptide repeat protein [Steroidobacteraceae bacterium]